MYFFVDKLIYFYIFICLSLLIFNILYIMRSGRSKRRRRTAVSRWKRTIREEAEWLERGGNVSEKHLALLRKRLSRVEELMAWQNALFSEGSLPEALRCRYLTECQRIVGKLAWDFQRRDSMERAFFAYVVSICYQDTGEEAYLVEPLLAYLEKSTVFLREHVLHALFVIGNESAIERAFDYLSDQGWFHNTKLVSDGLMLYRKDKEKLAERLWAHREHWSESLVVSVVQFASNISARLETEFFEALQEEDISIEIRFALIRYFRKNPWQECLPYLLKLLEEEQGLAIAAASALASYPQAQAREALKRALCNKSWYVRKNAALSLCTMGITQKEAEEIQNGKDRYAAEMLRYVMEERGMGL